MTNIFTSDEEYLTPLTAAHSLGYSQHEYRPRTLNRSVDKARQAILPVFPPRATLSSAVETLATAATTTISSSIHINEDQVDFLLCNVPKQLLTREQYERRQMDAYVSAFKLQTWEGIKPHKNYHSYMLTMYKNLYVELSKKWSIDKTILDYNLDRLQKCAMMKHFYFSYPDLPFVLEFFLQMDVDVFHLKTCTFRQGLPRVIIDTHGQQSYEGIFTIDEQSIEGRYGLRPCHQNNCLCCQNQSGTIEFNPKQIHTFLNRYQAILNCPVVCSTSNIIYALTCVCGEKDYVAHTNLSFVDCLAYHRREIVRTICEFLFGEINVELLDRIPKSEETKMNDENWLYRHSARCPAVLELFLNNNPSYWCFVPVPMKLEIRSRIHTPSPPAPPVVVAAAPPYTIQRQEELVQRLVDNVPKPLGYHEFTPEHVSEQKQFFKYCKDRNPINMHHLRFHQATIVAVLPDQSSALVRQFIESLFITHAECQLNRNGRLINQYFHQDYSVRGQWYRGLASRRPSL
ncbi:unnamed protein product [Adineta steineri]|uniref:Uncharacterized protein n=1 Tax=Adineta steineri TaxID=433720 RepID=A0A815SJV6_9BILA|nr:unnamed protein product [Adineta steineri]CAF4082275.1 unnamed protein product [Adineta steineri]